ncbi:MAG: YtxH domain-containing protein [Flavobacterium sp.]|nr:YtxH domain-containing protein [Pedobacter sp.]
MNNDKKTTTIGAVILVGLAAGAAAWYFMKTEKGRETADNLLDSLHNISSDIKDKTSDSFSQVSEQAKNVIDNLKTKTDQFRSKADNF